MKRLYYTFLRFIATSRLLWVIVSPFAKAGYTMFKTRENLAADMARRQKELKLLNETKHIFKEKIVLNGPFKGLKYPYIQAVGSAVFAKLLGTYESECHQVLEEICSRRYSEIINIGCGEGYYAVGLAIKITEAKVFAFDTSEAAQMLTKEMATLNNVLDRMTIGSFCSAEFLATFPFSEKGLIICDCEGCERELFRQATYNLSRSDLLIEIHDFIDVNISAIITNQFSDTHKIEIIRGIDDIQKTRSMDLAELNGFDFQTKYDLIREGRPGIMEWMYLTAFDNK